MFHDLFSIQAASYAIHRPRYPSALYRYLAEITPGRSLAIDCGTGNGQAAVDLATHFDQVIATEPSAEQLAHAVAHPRVRYEQAAAEVIPVDDACADIVTAAQAIHWFDLDRFYQEARRVLRRGGILAAWTYHFCEIDPAVDRAIERYYYDVVGDYWKPQIEYIASLYRTLPFPFPELKPPVLYQEIDWTLGDLVGFLRSWSASRAYEEQRGKDPLREIELDLIGAWLEPDTPRRVRWRIGMRVGRVE